MLCGIRSVHVRMSLINAKRNLKQKRILPTSTSPNGRNAFYGGLMEITKGSSIFSGGLTLTRTVRCLTRSSLTVSNQRAYPHLDRASLSSLKSLTRTRAVILITRSSQLHLNAMSLNRKRKAITLITKCKEPSTSACADGASTAFKLERQSIVRAEITDSMAYSGGSATCRSYTWSVSCLPLSWYELAVDGNLSTSSSRNTIPAEPKGGLMWISVRLGRLVIEKALQCSSYPSSSLDRGTTPRKTVPVLPLQDQPLPRVELITAQVDLHVERSPCQLELSLVVLENLKA